MTDFLTELPWPWYAAGLSLIAVLLYLADLYEQGLLPRARANLDTAPVLIGADIDPIDDTAKLEQEQLEHEFSADVESWLSARTKYDEWLGS